MNHLLDHQAFMQSAYSYYELYSVTKTVVAPSSDFKYTDVNSIFAAAMLSAAAASLFRDSFNYLSGGFAHEHNQQHSLNI
jgi:hypothetical protein